MGIVDDVLKAFDRIPIWQRLQTIPTELDKLQARIAELEEKLGGKWPADVCKFCGERAARLAHSHPAQKGGVQQNWYCEKCGNSETRIVK